jgi:hypothetical protein
MSFFSCCIFTAFAWPTVDTVCKADKAAGTAPICLKNVGVNTDNCLKFAVTVRSRAVQTNITVYQERYPNAMSAE